MPRVEVLVARLLRLAGVRIVREKTLQGLLRNRLLNRVVIELANGDLKNLASFGVLSKSQLGQDLFALHATGMKRGGFFVEFGAGDGVNLSNSYMLEKQFGWHGILSEPLPRFHESIRANRTAVLEPSCVWTESGVRLDFIDAGYLSTISEFRDVDEHSQSRASGELVSVISISLIELLRRHSAPHIIDFLSIDTEGSELAILRAFPFDAEYTIHAIACEHNHTNQREPIREFLESKGYVRVAPEASGHDDWFVLSASARSSHDE